jgi:hypothetical protein
MSSKSFKNQKPSDTSNPSRDALLNEGLRLAMEWGENMLKPIRNRLALSHPELSPSELDEVNAICQAAMKFGRKCVSDLVSKSGLNTKCEDVEPLIKARYPWIDLNNISRLFNQGMYYSMK